MAEVPHPLAGLRFKITRAEEQVSALRVAEDAFGHDADYEVVRAELDPVTGQYAYRLRVRSAALHWGWWGVRIGEIAHNLRSALDGLVYQLVLKNAKTPTRNHQFPIFETVRPDFEKATRRMLDGVKTEHRAVIERLQPYQSGRGGIRSYLYLLQEINSEPPRV